MRLSEDVVRIIDKYIELNDIDSRTEAAELLIRQWKRDMVRSENARAMIFVTNYISLTTCFSYLILQLWGLIPL
jgi:hypothetical protein